MKKGSVCVQRDFINQKVPVLNSRGDLSCEAMIRHVLYGTTEHSGPVNIKGYEIIQHYIAGRF